MNYSRILLKLSGEALMGTKGYGIDSKRINDYALEIKSLHKNKIQIDNNKETFGNLSSLLKCYETAKLEVKDLVYFVEDDYIHEEKCLVEMIETYERLSSQLKREIFGSSMITWKSQ